MKIKSVSIKNFRGIKNLENFQIDNLSLIIGNNGTSKTAVLEAINYCLSPSFLSGKIKPTDFHKGTDEPIEIILEFDENFIALLPDGYQKRQIECDKVYLQIKKRDKATPGKAFSDYVVLSHYVLPNRPKDNQQGWIIQRQNGSLFKFDERLLSFPLETEGLPKSYYFGKNREKQLQKGYRSSISSVYEDFNWRFAKNMRTDRETSDFFKKKQDIETEIKSKVDDKAVEKTFITLNEKLKEFDISPIDLSFIDGNAPFDSAFLNQTLENVEIPVSNLGSGIEMIISLLFLETLSSLSKDNFIILIDEPELHLHPIFQNKFINYLLSLSTELQVILSTHSPYFFKNCISKEGVELIIAKINNGEILFENTKINFGLFPWSPSWGEINYFAYGLATVEFHNELYGFLQDLSQIFVIREFDNWLESQGIPKTKRWIPERQGNIISQQIVTLQTFIRNKIHHPENITMQTENFDEEDLELSIEQMIELINNLESSQQIAQPD